MGIESDIIEKVEERLDLISTANDYNTDVAMVATRDENIHFSTLDAQSMLPALLIRYGDSGQVQDLFTDSPRIARVNEMFPIVVRAIVKDPGTGDTVTVRMSKLHEDVRKALGDSIRIDLASVFRASIVSWNVPFNSWGSAYEAVDFNIEVWHDWEARAITTATGTVLAAPLDIVPTFMSSNKTSGQASFAWTMPPTGVGVNLYRNGTKIVTLQATSPVIDSVWHIDHYYQLGAEDVSANEVLSPILQFPLYPNTAPEVNYYLPTWLLSTQKLGLFALGDTTPEMLIENEIRREIERERLSGGRFTDDVSYTAAGPLLNTQLTSARMPLVHIESESSSTSFANSSEDELEATINVNVYDNADVAAADRIDSRTTVNRILHHLRAMGMASGIDTVVGEERNVQDWNSIAGVQFTQVGGVTWSRDAQAVGNQLVYWGRITYIVRFRWKWR